MGIRDGLRFREKRWLFAGSCDFELVGFVKVEKFVGDNFLKVVFRRFLIFRIGRFVKLKNW